MCIFIVWYTLALSRLHTIYNPCIGTLFYSRTSSGENLAFVHFVVAIQSLQFSFLIPQGTHHYWVDRGGMIWEAWPAV